MQIADKEVWAHRLDVASATCVKCAWTKTFLHLGAKAIWCLDAAPAEHTGFYENVGSNKTVNYICVKDLRDPVDQI